MKIIIYSIIAMLFTITATAENSLFKGLVIAEREGGVEIIEMPKTAGLRFFYQKGDIIQQMGDIKINGFQDFIKASKQLSKQGEVRIIVKDKPEQIITSEAERLARESGILTIDEINDILMIDEIEKRAKKSHVQTYKLNDVQTQTDNIKKEILALKERHDRLEQEIEQENTRMLWRYRLLAISNLLMNIGNAADHNHHHSSPNTAYTDLQLSEISWELNKLNRTLSDISR